MNLAHSLLFLNWLEANKRRFIPQTKNLWNVILPVLKIHPAAQMMFMLNYYLVLYLLESKHLRHLLTHWNHSPPRNIAYRRVLDHQV